ncbi:MAG: hypothetical protein FJX03_00500 [Alphaproteobacteria bacterium]|nr:hypothetical protein [Alphaproteobacteria bacterium]
MAITKTIQYTLFVLGFSILHEARAESILDQEGIFEDSDAAPSLVEENIENEAEIVEVVAKVKENEPRLAERLGKRPRKNLSLIHLPSNGGKGLIIDETATTGENANRHLPIGIRKEPMQVSYVQQINQAIPHSVSLDFIR